MKIHFSLLISLLIFLVQTISAQQKLVPFTHPNIHFEGRINFKDNAACLNWSGSSISLNFEGSEISAILQDVDTANYYNVIVDNKVISKINLETKKKKYLLASGLSKGNHSVQLYKRTQWGKGQTLFFGFEMDSSAKILPKSKPKKKKLAFYGDSITCGHGNEDNTGKDSGTGHFENHYLTYGALTSRYFNAQNQSISNSGIGIMLSWFPYTITDIYDLTDPHDKTKKWDFDNYVPDIVIINLFQNDSWLVNKLKHPEFITKFGTEKPTDDFIIKSYENFVKFIRAKHPKAAIICVLGSMDITKQGSKWPNYVQRAVANIGDKKIYTHFFAYKNTPGHPKVNEHKTMAESLIAFIEKNINW